MRIGFDMLAVQSPHHGHRGIGRYSRHLVSALMAVGEGHQYVLYAHDELPADRIPIAPNAQVRRIGTEPGRGIRTVSQYLERLARDNPDALDVLVVLSPFEIWNGYQPPGPTANGLKLAAVVYDMIPFLFQQEDVYDSTLMRFYRTLESLRRYDALLAISEATRADCRALLGLPDRQVVNIGAASDDHLFKPAEGPPSEATREMLRDLGITRPYVLNVGGFDERKNPRGMIEAFARLPESLRLAYQLVMTFTILPEDADILRQHAEGLGVGDALVVTGEVSDETLRVLYQRSSLFAFPSSYEGFGLPILEALQSGVPVIAGGNSSQVEVVGDAGLLVNVNDPSDIAAKLARVLDDPALMETLRSRTRAQASRFSWASTAALASTVLDNLPTRRPASWLRVDRAHGGKPRIAFFSPLPPRKSGVSDYSVLLLRELARTYTIDLYHDRGYVPELGLASDEFRCRDYRAFARYAPVLDYHAVVYQMGNSRYHDYLYDTMLRVPGVVTLHDFCLAGFYLRYGLRRGLGIGPIRDELLTWYPEHADAIRARQEPWTSDGKAIASECAREGWYLNRRLLASPNHVVVHSPWCVRQMQETRPELAARMSVIPHGASARRLSESERWLIRDRFGIPRDALMVASFGFIHPDKLSIEALDAFADVARTDGSALFVFVGEDADGGNVRRHAESLGLGGRVRFLGRRTLAEFADLAAATDVGVNLRRPPTHGETSGALLYLLSSGVATIVTDVATFSDYPGHVVRKVRWETEGPEGLRRALFDLTRDRTARETLGRAAQEHVREHHEWPRVAEQYVDAIERFHSAHAAASQKPLALARPRIGASDA